MSNFGYIDLFIDPNPNCVEGCGLRYKAESVPRPITKARFFTGPDESVVCTVTGWSSANGGSACPAQAVLVEDSGSGTAWLVFGGDWGLRLTPVEGEPFGEPYLLISESAILG